MVFLGRLFEAMIIDLDMLSLEGNVVGFEYTGEEKLWRWKVFNGWETYSLISNLETFSDYVSEMNARATQVDAQELVCWAVDHLSKVLGYDHAWYGWVNLSTQRIKNIQTLR